ncbi:MAG TPA: pilin [Candidatus Paceibacterota bacterium]|nr:pilin [Candidatus Paceibacterota bacterium]
MTSRLLILALFVSSILVPAEALAQTRASYTFTTTQSQIGRYWIEAYRWDEANKCTSLDLLSYSTKQACDAALGAAQNNNNGWKYFGKCEKIDQTSYTYTVDVRMCPGTISKYSLKPVEGTALPGGTPGGPTDPGGTPGGPTDPGGTPGGPTDPGGTPAGPTGGLTNPIKFDSLEQLLEAVLAAIVRIGTIVLTLALVYVGFLFVVAQGNEEKIRNARSALLWTVIGGLILLGASALGQVIKATVNSIQP